MALCGNAYTSKCLQKNIFNNFFFFSLYIQHHIKLLPFCHTIRILDENGGNGMSNNRKKKYFSHFFSLSAKRLCAGTFSLPLPHPFTNEQKKKVVERRRLFCGAERTNAEVCSMLYRIADYFPFHGRLFKSKKEKKKFVFLRPTTLSDFVFLSTQPTI